MLSAGEENSLGDFTPGYSPQYYRDHGDNAFVTAQALTAYLMQAYTECPEDEGYGICQNVSPFGYVGASKKSMSAISCPLSR